MFPRLDYPRGEHGIIWPYSDTFGNYPVNTLRMKNFESNTSHKPRLGLMDKLLTVEEIADVLNVKQSTIYNWTHLGFIPHIKIGKLLRFNEDDVLKWLNKKSIPGRKNRKIDTSRLAI